MRRNDVAQYDELVGEWWRPAGAFAMLHWIAAARARLIPPAPQTDAVLLDVGCGGGLLHPHVVDKGYRHVGVDLVQSALQQAAAHGVEVIRGDATRIPLRDACADVVSIGEVLEHVADWPAATTEACRVLRPGGRLILDTINATRVARWLVITLAERIPGGAPPGIHDSALFVNPLALQAECARHGVALEVRGLRPALITLVRWMLTKRGDVPMVPTWSTAVLYQGWGCKSG